jgi:hypothetical protein
MISNIAAQAATISAITIQAGQRASVCIAVFISDR